MNTHLAHFYRNYYLIVFSIGLLYPLQLKAQESTPIEEPPIPVYTIHQRANHSTAIDAYGIADTDFAKLERRYDSLQTQVQQTSAQVTAYFTWLYTLIALLGTISVISLLYVVQMKKDLHALKHAGHHTSSSQMLAYGQSARILTPPTHEKKRGSHPLKRIVSKRKKR